ncbi:MAG: plasmid stabilization protein [Pseudomonadota bacterium]
MGDMLIRNIPEPLKHEIEDAARLAGQSLSGKAIDLLRKGIVAEKKVESKQDLCAWDAIRSAFEVENAVDDGFAEIMNEIEAERKGDFGRLVEDLG